MALGVTQQLPLNDKYTYSKKYLKTRLAVLLAGRVSEEMFLDQITTGAGNDFEKATSIARKMVCEWGMSPLGTLTYGQKDEMVFLGRDMMVHNEYSEETARSIDREIKKIIDEAYARARSVMEKHRKELETIAAMLLEKESLSSQEIKLILNGKSEAVNRSGSKKKTVSKSGDSKAGEK